MSTDQLPLNVDRPRSSTTRSQSAGQASSAGSAEATGKEDLLPWFWIGGLTLLLIASYANSLWPMVYSWIWGDQYQLGFIIPLFAVVMIWLRRRPIGEVSDAERWWGVGVIAFGITMRLVGTYYFRITMDQTSFIPTLAGIFLLIGGWKTLKWAGPLIAFMVLMIPWPDLLVTHVLKNLQTIAVFCSTYVIQTIGIEAYRAGNVIHLDSADMNVVDACSGLRMLTIFIALTVAMAILMTDRPIWERLVIVLSAIPVAIAVNVFRIVAMGIGYASGLDHGLVESWLHDGAGLFMMPLALGIVFAEMQILANLVIVDENEPEMISNLRKGRAPVGPPVPAKN